MNWYEWIIIGLMLLFGLSMSIIQLILYSKEKRKLNKQMQSYDRRLTDAVRREEVDTLN